ncbi:metal ABC transporter substrate-binding protein [Propionicicella superfundia]|uniref:metal ABC transporter substrate-binding protein n=1 Tax=Propionicicella superfundia TaxID=348582 RepID=UPI001FDFFDA5|nr:metal ABC transporter substrate-binding protein [Propionicicella superfundia]
MSNRILAGLVAATLLAFGLTACSPAAESGKLKVVAAFYPLAYIAETVGGDQVEVSNLTQPGAEPHDLELTAQQIASISDADLVLYQKGFQSAVDKAIEANPPKHAIDTSTLVTMLEATAEDEHEGEEHEGEDEHTTDPHTWLAPQNMVAFTTAVTDELKQLGSSHADTFATNGAQLTSDLKELDSRYSTGLKTCSVRDFITSHAAFGYLAKAYDLTQHGIAGLDPSVEPTTARIAEIQSLATQYKITTIFFETLASPAIAESIATDLNLKTDVLDPLEGVTEDSQGTNYMEIMDSNLTALKKANSCS